MKRTALLILCGGLAVGLAACRPEQTHRGQAGNRSSAASSPPAPAMPSAGDSVMDYSPAPSGPGAAGAAPAGGGDLKAALADLDRILKRQQALAKLWQSIKSPSEAGTIREALVKGSLEVLALTIASLRKAVQLSPADLRTFLGRQKAMNEQAAGLNRAIRSKQDALKSTPEGKALFDRLRKDVEPKVRAQAKSLVVLGRQLLARQKELKR